ncbi:hypothetical protein [Cupriavidus pinatubonensis]|uniref:hypothetical protein n=1 Tax=Cupriavidus pinatubonensis TaxID=248026 RepID=UPI001CC6C90A|nr:hypothetical protein [Cupriavidus pinatubonensis]
MGGIGHLAAHAHDVDDGPAPLLRLALDHRVNHIDVAEVLASAGLANAYGKQGVRVNAVNPSATHPSLSSRVWKWMRASATAVARLAEGEGEFAGHMVAISADLIDISEAARAVDEAVTGLGGIDILVVLRRRGQAPAAGRTDPTAVAGSNDHQVP